MNPALAGTVSRLSVTAPAAATRLTTVARVRSLLCVRAELSDDAVGALIDSASASIAAFLAVAGDGVAAPTLGRETLREEIALPAGGAVEIVLTRRPALALLAVAEDGAASLDPAADYALDRAGGIFWKTGRTAFSAEALTVDYLAGYLLPGEEGRTLPQHIEDAAVRLVQRLTETLTEGDNPRIAQESFAGIGSWTYELSKIDWDGGLPSDVRAILSPMRRRYV